METAIEQINKSILNLIGKYAVDTLKADALNWRPCSDCLSFSNQLIESYEFTNVVAKKINTKTKILIKNGPIVKKLSDKYSAYARRVFRFTANAGILVKLFDALSVFVDSFSLQ